MCVNCQNAVVDITSMAMDGLKDCIIGGEVNTLEYEFYRQNFILGLEYFERKEREEKKVNLPLVSKRLRSYSGCDGEKD